MGVLKDQRPPAPPKPEVARELVASLPAASSQAIVLQGVRRCGKSNLQAQLMRRGGTAFYCNLEDTRLFGLSPEDFPTMLAAIEELAPGDVPVFLDEVQEVLEWERLVRSLLDRGRQVCVTGSNASLLGRELGAKLTGRHLSFEVFPFRHRHPGDSGVRGANAVQPGSGDRRGSTGLSPARQTPGPDSDPQPARPPEGIGHPGGGAAGLGVVARQLLKSPVFPLM